MLAQYEGAESYQDTGQLRVLSNLRSVLSPAGYSQPPEPAVSFQTFFARPKLFRFDWLNSPAKTSRNSVVWFTGDRGYVWAPDVRGEDRFIFYARSALDSVVDDVIRPSKGTVLTVPSLLIRSLEPYTFADDIKNLSGVRMIRQEVVDGEICYVIYGKASSNPWVLWVGKKTSLLRKMRSVMSNSSFDQLSKRRESNTVIAEETHRSIRINGKIAPETFLYAPSLRPGDIDLTR